MYATNFEYDGQYLSDFGFIVCQFDGSSGTNIISAGSEITFNKVSMHSGKISAVTSTQYDLCLEATFDIAKDPDKMSSKYITQEEERSLMRWLNRREYLRFSICDEERDSVTVYYDGSFNIEKIKVGERLCGLRLKIQTNRPFGYGDLHEERWDVTSDNLDHIIIDDSDEIGSIYVDATIECHDEGNLEIYNALNKRTTYIGGCKVGEVITLYGIPQIIETSEVDHNVYNEFNYVFPTISNTYEDRINRITVSIPCTITYRYYPIIKDSI